jgi:hypothetical protein
MSKDILGSLVRVLVTVPEDRLGLVQDLANKLAGSDGDRWARQGGLFLRKEPCWVIGQIAQTPAIPVHPFKSELLLKPVGTITIAAASERFVAKDRFVVNTEDDTRVKISNIGNNFTKWFLSGDGKTEDPIAEQTMRYDKLCQISVDMPTVAELGGEEKSETTLTETFFLMGKQWNGGSGALLNNGLANIFRIRDQNGVLRAVFVGWYGGGWVVYAGSVDGPLEGFVDAQVFSRLPAQAGNSVLKSSEPVSAAS